MTRKSRGTRAAAAGAALLLAAALGAAGLAAAQGEAPAEARAKARDDAPSPWCGENGLVRFSFDPGDTIVDVRSLAAGAGGVTEIDLYAWLTDVEPVARRGEAFLRVGAAELKLAIEGAQGFITEQEFPSQALNVGQGNGSLIVAYVPGQRLEDGRARLVRWHIMFQGAPQNVRFGLDPAAGPTCDSVPGCPESGSPALFAGTEAARMLDVVFGAGYVPAWLNPAEEQPDQTPVRGKTGWREVGVFEARAERR